eukprot:197673-Amphidinium_carterae.1
MEPTRSRDLRVSSPEEATKLGRIACQSSRWEFAPPLWKRDLLPLGKLARPPFAHLPTPLSEARQERQPLSETSLRERPCGKRGPHVPQLASPLPVPPLLRRRVYRRGTSPEPPRVVGIQTSCPAGSCSTP